VANIYESREEEIHALLNRASAVSGATVVIPDLQRPYVWEPNQVNPARGLTHPGLSVR